MPSGRAVVVMGPAGSGKTTAGKALARRLGWSFVQGDGFHPPPALRTTAARVPLNDADRAPWLRRLNALLRTRTAHRESVVLACSALRERYRQARARGGRGGGAFVLLPGGPP